MGPLYLCRATSSANTARKGSAILTIAPPATGAAMNIGTGGGLKAVKGGSATGLRGGKGGEKGGIGKEGRRRIKNDLS